MTPRQHQLRRQALAALAALDRPEARPRLLFDGYNVTYEVLDRGERLALRLTRPGVSLAHVQGEVAWMTALARDSDVRVAEPVGVCVVDEQVCVLTRWVHGVTRHASLTPRAMAAVGETMAALHDHASHWTRPGTWSRPDVGSVWLGSPDPTPQLPADVAERFTACASRLRPILAQLMAGEVFVLHADLHQWNVKLAPGHDVGVLDFDDCAVGHPAMDLAISRYYLGGHPRCEELRAALERGYRRRRPWPADPELLEALHVWRMLGLCASVLDHPTEALRAKVGELLPRWDELATEYLRS